MKIRIKIKSILGRVLFEYEKENNTIKDTLVQAIKESINLRFADLRFADLRFADLEGADLRSAYLEGANLEYANLEGADLRSANLRSAYLEGANLEGAYLEYANLDKRYIQIGCIGASKRMTTYCFEDDKIWCGCFTGNLKDFEKEVKKTHKNNKQYLNEYLGFIDYLKKIKDNG